MAIPGEEVVSANVRVLRTDVEAFGGENEGGGVGEFIEDQLDNLVWRREQSMSRLNEVLISQGRRSVSPHRRCIVAAVSCDE